MGDLADSCFSQRPRAPQGDESTSPFGGHCLSIMAPKRTPVGQCPAGLIPPLDKGDLFYEMVEDLSVRGCPRPPLSLRLYQASKLEHSPDSMGLVWSSRGRSCAQAHLRGIMSSRWAHWSLETQIMMGQLLPVQYTSPGSATHPSFPPCHQEQGSQVKRSLVRPEANPPISVHFQEFPLMKQVWEDWVSSH